MVFRKDRKNSQVIIQNLLACYSILVPITFFIVFLYLNIVLEYTHPPSETFGEWFCFAYEYFAHATGIYLGAFSLFTAMMKYWFIVDNARSKSFGEEKGRTIFLILHLTIPLMIAALNSISNGQKDHIYTYLRTGWHSMQENFSTEEEADIIMMTDAFTCLLYTSPSPRDQRGSRYASSG